MFDPQVTVVGNLVADPKLSFTKDGSARATFRLAATQRRYDRSRGEWHDGDSFFANVTCWRGVAENVCASLRRGQSALVTGRIATRRYEARDGSTRDSVDIEADAVGVDLSRTIAVVKRAERGVPVSPPTPEGASTGEAREAVAATSGGTTGDPDRGAGAGIESAVPADLESALAGAARLAAEHDALVDGADDLHDAVDDDDDGVADMQDDFDEADDPASGRDGEPGPAPSGRPLAEVGAVLAAPTEEASSAREVAGSRRKGRFGLG
jgi:single-strand DNA-binding protein